MNRRITKMFTENDGIGLSGDTEDLNFILTEKKFAELALMFPNVNSILIPKKALYNLSKYASKPLLKAIDPNINTAIEKCLLVLSNLSVTYYTEDKWKRLYSPILHEQTKTSDNTYIYPKIIELLKQGTKQGAFIEVNDKYNEGKSKEYRLTETYLKAGLVEYIIKDTKIIQRLNSIYFQRLSNAFKNPICTNLIDIYPRVELPTSEELLVIGKQLVKEGHRTKKGKLLTMRNKHTDNYWNDHENRSFVEDNIKLFEFLTGRGFMIPSAGSEKSGGRVVDSFTLMPSWIRGEIVIDGKKLTECDYTALHPNIAVKLYGGSEEYITHQKVAERASIDAANVKIEHLGFFNKRWSQMQKSSLFSYYKEHEPAMLENIRKDKQTGHKVTSRRMFKTEVDIMTDVIIYLNTIGIQVLYVYDALLCEEKDRQLVVETMNRIILEHGVKTSVKMDVPMEKPMPQQVKYRLDEEINLYDVLPTISFSIEESASIILDIKRGKVLMSELLQYIAKQRREQQYNDYKGVPITTEHIGALKAIIAA